MKLIIDIPEEDRKDIGNIHFVREDLKFKIGKAIMNGTPLDSVKAEIEKQIERDFAFAETETLKVPCHYGIANGLQNAIRFLDNIGKTESEE